MAAPVCPWGQTSHWPSRRLEGVLSWERAPRWGAASAGLGSCPAPVVGPRSGRWGPSPHTEEVALISTALPPSFGGQRPLSSPSHHTLHQGNRELKCLPGHHLPSGVLADFKTAACEGSRADGLWEETENSGTDNCTLPMRAPGPGTEVAPMPCCQRRGQDSIPAPGPHSQDRAALSPGPPCPSGEQGRGLPVPWV